MSFVLDNGKADQEKTYHPRTDIPSCKRFSLFPHIGPPVDIEHFGVFSPNSRVAMCEEGSNDDGRITGHI